jgi:hypothetical protein
MQCVLDALVLAFCVASNRLPLSSRDEDFFPALFSFVKSKFIVRNTEPTNVSVLYESKHPYDNSQDYDIDIHFPGATSIEIVFDEKCRTEGGCDYVRFKADDKVVGSDKYTGRGDGAHWAGVNSVPKLVGPGCKVTGHFHSDGSENDWGYKFTATARVVQRCDDPYVQALYDSLMECFINMVICDGKFRSELLNGSLSPDVTLDVVSLVVSSWKHPLVSPSAACNNVVLFCYIMPAFAFEPRCC